MALLAGIAAGCGARPAAHGSDTIVYAVGRENVSQLQGLVRVDADGSHRTRLTQEPPPSATDPLWAPAGDTILFSEGARNGAIWTINPDGSGARQIADGFDASWSPDGGEIAVVTAEDTVDILSRAGERLRTIDLGLAKGEVLTQAPPAWSPDGQMLAVEAYSDDDYYGVIYLAPTNGKGTASVLIPESEDFDGSPVWSPNGERIAFTHGYSDVEEIWASRPDGSDRRIVARNVYRVLAWSVDGGSVIAQSSTRDNGIYAYPLDGGKPRRLPKAEAERALSAGRLSPDGTRKVTTNGGGRLVVSRVDGSEPRVLTKPVSYSEPAWSPDGTEIAFVRESGGEETWETALNVIGADGKDERRLELKYPPRHLVWGPLRWSPDGTTLLAQAGWQGTEETEVIRLTSGRMLTIPDGAASAWSPDGSTIALVINRLERTASTEGSLSSILATIRRDGTGLRELAQSRELFDYPVWTPDGLSILIAERSEKTTRILEIPANGGRARTLIRDPSLQTFYADTVAVSPDGKRAALVSDKGIETVSLTSGQRTVVVPHEGGEGGMVVALAWAPDGKELGYIAFHNEVDAIASLYLVKPDGSDRRMISKPAEWVASFDWRPESASD